MSRNAELVPMLFFLGEFHLTSITDVHIHPKCSMSGGCSDGIGTYTPFNLKMSEVLLRFFSIW